VANNSESYTVAHARLALASARKFNIPEKIEEWKANLAAMGVEESEQSKSLSDGTQSAVPAAPSMDDRVDELFESRPYMRRLLNADQIKRKLKELDDQPYTVRTDLKPKDGLITVATVLVNEDLVNGEFYTRVFPGALSEQEIIFEFFKESPRGFNPSEIAVDAVQIFRVS